jgi:SAM-dependent methyltransferase
MDMTALAFEDGSIDAVTSRMGLFLPGTAPFDVAAREAARVLRPDGLLSLATWTDLASSPYTGVGLPVLRRILPPGTIPDFNAPFAESARPGALETHLAEAGFRSVEPSWFRWRTEYPSFDAWWEFDTGFVPLQAWFDALDGQQLAAARSAMAEDISEYRTGTGSYRLPATSRVITARR